MKKYTTLYEAVMKAIDLCDSWRYMYADEVYFKANFPGIAKVYDEDSMVDEDSFYVVAPSGAIGFSEDEGETIEWLFVRYDNQTEKLPSCIREMESIIIETDKGNFCENCKAPFEAGSKFCENCGAPL